MRFILEDKEEDEQVTFDNVEQGQFFIDTHGYLCQKENSLYYSRLTDMDGTPKHLCRIHAVPASPINKVLPKVERIKY